MDEEKIRTTLGVHIAELRKTAGLTQGQLGEKLGYSDKSVSKWERGEGVPDVYVLKKLTEIFNCSADTLLGVEPVGTDFGTHAQNRRTKRKMIPVLSVLLVWLTAARDAFFLVFLSF